jgi:hypothetical protein
VNSHEIVGKLASYSNIQNDKPFRKREYIVGVEIAAAKKCQHYSIAGG